jgi:hypothetical protein
VIDCEIERRNLLKVSASVQILNTGLAFTLHDWCRTSLQEIPAQLLLYCSRIEVKEEKHIAR